MSNVIRKDIAVIGAGPVGLFMVFEAGFLGYNCAVIDSLPEIGGQLTALYPEKPIYDIPGLPNVLAGDLIKNLEEQAAPFEPEYVLGHPVSAVEKLPDGSFKLQAGDDTIMAKVVVIAGGMGVFTPRRPPLADLAAFENKSVFYAVRGRDKFAGKTLAIAGGGDSAADWAVELADAAKHVHVIHRRESFRAAEATLHKMRELEEMGKITIHTPCQLAKLSGDRDAGQLQHITLKNAKDGSETDLPCDNLLCFFGLAPAFGPIAEWGINLHGKKVAVEAHTMQTNIDGILAIGDITDYAGKLDLILTGFAESAIAAKTAQGIISPEKKFKLVYTTSRGIPNSNAS